jgi:hypothetical protein
MGVRDKETNVEITIAPETTMANSLKSLPVNPSRKKMGRNTQTRLIEVAITAKKTSREPLKAA